MTTSTYLAKFIPNYSQVAAPLRILLEKGTDWHWAHQQEASFQELKDLLACSPLLQFYDPQKPSTVSVDASSKGIGGSLAPRGRPNCICLLTTSQSNYAKIEKEMLAVVFGCTKFYDCIYGLCNVLVETDHKSLESILRKPLYQAPARLQRMIMLIQKYPITVEYKAGKQLYIADTLSRAPLSDKASDL